MGLLKTFALVSVILPVEQRGCGVLVSHDWYKVKDKEQIGYISYVVVIVVLKTLMDNREIKRIQCMCKLIQS